MAGSVLREAAAFKREQYAAREMAHAAQMSLSRLESANDDSLPCRFLCPRVDRSSRSPGVARISVECPRSLPISLIVDD
jgi:hypothetical protein